MNSFTEAQRVGENRIFCLQISLEELSTGKTIEEYCLEKHTTNSKSCKQELMRYIRDSVRTS